MSRLSLAGHPGGHQAPEGHRNGQGAGVTIGRGIAMAPATTASWRENGTARGRRGRARTGTEESGNGDDLVAQKETKTGESVKEVTAAVGTGGANVGIKKGMEETTGAGKRSEITIRTGALTGRGPGIEGAGERQMNEGIKTIGTDTGRRRRLNDQAAVEAETGNTKRTKAGNGSAATAKRRTESETGRRVHTNVVVAKRGAIISESRTTTTRNTAIAEGARAQSKCGLTATRLPCFPLSSMPLSGQSCAKEQRHSSVGNQRSLSSASVTFVFFCCLLLQSSVGPHSKSVKRLKRFLIFYGCF